MTGAILSVALGGLVWVYLGYPVLVLILSRIAPWRSMKSSPAPSLTVAIAVHDEAAVIEERIADVFAQDDGEIDLVQVIVGSDGSGDGTNEVVTRMASFEPRLQLVALPRAGQTSTQDALFAVAT